MPTLEFVQSYVKQQNKGEYDVNNCDYELLTDEYSVDLLKNLYYPEIVAQAAKNYRPAIIYKVLQVHSINSNNNKVITENKEQTQVI